MYWCKLKFYYLYICYKFVITAYFSMPCPFRTLQQSEANFKRSGWGWKVNPVSLCQHNMFLFIWRGCSFRLYASVTQLPNQAFVRVYSPAHTWMDSCWRVWISWTEVWIHFLYTKKNGRKTSAKFFLNSLL